jgi:hypothetical protein
VCAAKYAQIVKSRMAAGPSVGPICVAAGAGIQLDAADPGSIESPSSALSPGRQGGAVIFGISHGGDERETDVATVAGCAALTAGNETCEWLAQTAGS